MGGTLSFDSKNNDYEIYNVFEQLASLAFNYKGEAKNIANQAERKIDQKNLSLLFAWPGILMLRLALVTGDAKYENSINDLIEMLDNDDIDQIKHYLDTIIDAKNIPKNIQKEIQQAQQDKKI